MYMTCWKHKQLWCQPSRFPCSFIFFTGICRWTDKSNSQDPVELGNQLMSTPITTAYHILVEENFNWSDTSYCQRPPWSSRPCCPCRPQCSLCKNLRLDTHFWVLGHSAPEIMWGMTNSSIPWPNEKFFDHEKWILTYPINIYWFTKIIKNSGIFGVHICRGK